MKNCTQPADFLSETTDRLFPLRQHPTPKAPGCLRVPGVSMAAPSSAPALRVPRMARGGSASQSGWRSPPARRPSWPRRASAGASRAGHAAPAPRGCGRRRHGQGPSWSARAPGVRAAPCGRGGPRCRRCVRRLVLPSHNSLDLRPRPARSLYLGRPSTNISKDMCAVNRPNLNSCNGLTGI